MWLVASAELTDLAVVRDNKPALWRDLRRFNAPIQLAVAAAHEVLTRAVAPAELSIISLAPCQSGSPDLHRWVRDIETRGAVRVNPTHTLHAVDNLALSVLSIALKNHAWSMSLGGAAGMAWSALELVLERHDDIFTDKPNNEMLVFGGDQLSGIEASPAAAFAMLFAREPTPNVMTGRPIRLVAIERRPRATKPRSEQDFVATRPRSEDDSVATVPHAARGVLSMLAALRAAPIGHFMYVVPAADGDGLDDIVVRWEVGA